MNKMKKSIVGAAVAVALVGGVIIGGQTTIMGQAHYQESNLGIHNYIDGTHDIGHHVTAPNADRLEAQVQAQIDADNAKAAAQAKADAQMRAQTVKSQAAPVVQSTKATNYSCGYCGSSSCKGDCRNSAGTHHSENKSGRHNSGSHHNGGHH